MATMVRDRDMTEEGEERDRYVILLHLHTLGKDSAEGRVGLERIAADLGFSEARAAELLKSLVLSEYVRYAVGDSVALTRRGIEYIERLAGRRRSLRFRARREEGGDPGFDSISRGV